MKMWELILVIFFASIFWHASKDLMETFTKMPWWDNELVTALAIGLLIILATTIAGMVKRK